MVEVRSGYGEDKYLEQKASLKAGVLMGGWSDEREISLASGQAVIDALKDKGWQAAGIDVDKQVWERIKAENIDVAFLTLHGRYGEDGTIQGMLEIMGIPYTGSGVLASSLAINKIMAKRIFQSYNIATPHFVVLEDKAKIVSDSPLGYPVVIKPCSQGSTIGVNIVKTKKELNTAIEESLRYDEKIFLEEFISGRELTVGIIESEPLPVLEIRPKSGFYDFYSKYTLGETEYLCPAPIDEDLTLKIQGLGLLAHQALGCSDFSRVDFRLREDSSIFCLEVNTIPGMTKTSLLPKAAKQQGIAFPDLVERILLMALKRKKNAGECYGR